MHPAPAIATTTASRIAETGGASLCCPICGSHIDVEPRVTGSNWTPRQRWLLDHLRSAGFGPKLIGWVLGTTPRAIACFLDKQRHA